MAGQVPKRVSLALCARLRSGYSYLFCLNWLYFCLVSNNAASEWYSQCTPDTGGGGGGGGGGTSPDPTTTAGGNTPAPTGGSGAAGGLHDKFKAKGKTYFGTEIDHYHLSNSALTTIAKNSFGQVTPENSMKWDALEREYPAQVFASRFRVPN
jgi:endo-1,4-beta-xylanase